MTIEKCHFRNIITAYSLENDGLSGAIYIKPKNYINATIKHIKFVNVTAKISGAGIYIDKNNEIDITL